jgi:hypothetical protein
MVGLGPGGPMFGASAPPMPSARAMVTVVRSIWVTSTSIEPSTATGSTPLLRRLTGLGQEPGLMSRPAPTVGGAVTVTETLSMRTSK